jgi:hypothetical protein
LDEGELAGAVETDVTAPGLDVGEAVGDCATAMFAAANNPIKIVIATFIVFPRPIL